MSFGKTALMASFAFLGFLVGSALYLVISWIIMNSAAGVLYVPVPIFAPWFMAGLVGSFTAVIFLFVISHFSGET